MIMNDLPALLRATQDESKSSVRLVSCPLEMPAAKDDRGIVSHRRDFEVRKSQRAHLFPRVVVFLITLEHSLPATRDVIAGNENRVFRALVAIHVTGHITAIPGIALRVEHGTDSRDDVAFAFVWGC